MTEKTSLTGHMCIAFARLETVNTSPYPIIEIRERPRNILQKVKIVISETSKTTELFYKISNSSSFSLALDIFAHFIPLTVLRFKKRLSHREPICIEATIIRRFYIETIPLPLFFLKASLRKFNCEFSFHDLWWDQSFVTRFALCVVFCRDKSLNWLSFYLDVCRI